MARPTKFTPLLAEKVVTALRAGMLLHDAAEYAGIHRDTLTRWLKRGETIRNPLHPQSEFYDAVLQARSAAKLRAIACVHKHMATDWRAGAWWLQVTDPKHFGPKIRFTLEQEFSDALARVAKRLPADVYEQVLDAVLEDGGGAGESPAPAGAKVTPEGDS